MAEEYVDEDNGEGPVTHLPELDEDGEATDYTLCGADTGFVSNSWRADCSDCHELREQGITQQPEADRGV